MEVRTVSAEPWEVIMMTGNVPSILRTCLRTSTPLTSGNLTSRMTRSSGVRRAISSVSAPLRASRISASSVDRIRLSKARTADSSSTMRMWGLPLRTVAMTQLRCVARLPSGRTGTFFRGRTISSTPFKKRSRARSVSTLGGRATTSLNRCSPRAAWRM